MAQNKNLSSVMNNSLFRGITDPGFKLNYYLKDFIEIEDGGIIYQAGDLSDAIYLIIEGEVKLKFSGTHLVDKKRSNEFFGEKEALDNLARKSSAVANKNSILYMIKKNDLLSLIQRNNEIKSKLLGEQTDQLTNEVNHKEFNFNEPKDRISDLPFFKKKTDVPIHDETEVIKNEVEPLNDEVIPIPEVEYNEVTEDEIVNVPHVGDKVVLEEVYLFSNDNFPKSNDEEPVKPVFEQIPEMEETQKAEFKESVGPSSDRPVFIDAILRIFSGLGAEEIFITIPEAICELLKAKQGRLFLIDKGMNELRTRIKDENVFSDIRLNFTDNLFSQAVNRKKIINLVSPPIEELEKISSASDIQSLLIFPLINQKEEIAGVLELNNSIYGEFEQKDIEELIKITPLIVLALKNADFIQNLLHSDRLISLNKMANFLIQDIKNPIVTIKQYAEHIKTQKINEEVAPVLDMIEEQAEAVMNLVQTTLGYSEGMLVSKLQTLLLSTTMDNILALLAEYVESRDVKLYKKYNGDGLVHLDKKEFYQACFQIAKNACDAMPQGGNFYITVTREDGNIKIEFKDTGLGIPDSIKDRIFEPFMSHGKDDHSGLGLAIAEKIVKEHNGKIWAESDLGEGSVIIIVLPVID